MEGAPARAAAGLPLTRAVLATRAPEARHGTPVYAVPEWAVPGSNGRPPARKARQPLDRPAGFRAVERDPASERPWSCGSSSRRVGFLTESSSIGIGDVARVRVQSLVANSLDGR